MPTYMANPPSDSLSYKCHTNNDDGNNTARATRSAPNSRNNSGGNSTSASKGGCSKKELLNMEHSSVSTDSSTHSSNSTTSKLSMVGTLTCAKTKQSADLYFEIHSIMAYIIIFDSRLVAGYVIVAGI